jgi:hypothetical protein
MGMELSVHFSPGRLPEWPSLRDFLASRGFAVQTRMIDGQLAFPDEAPHSEWTELRLATGHGMVTLRRSSDELTFVVWGNADAALLQERNALVWSCAHLGGGQIDTGNERLSADDYWRSAELSTSFRDS